MHTAWSEGRPTPAVVTGLLTLRAIRRLVHDGRQRHDAECRRRRRRAPPSVPRHLHLVTHLPTQVLNDGVSASIRSMVATVSSSAVSERCKGDGGRLVAGPCTASAAAGNCVSNFDCTMAACPRDETG